MSGVRRLTLGVSPAADQPCGVRISWHGVAPACAGRRRLRAFPDPGCSAQIRWACLSRRSLAKAYPDSGHSHSEMGATPELGPRDHRIPAESANDCGDDYGRRLGSAAVAPRSSPIGIRFKALYYIERTRDRVVGAGGADPAAAGPSFRRVSVPPARICAYRQRLTQSICCA